MRRRDKHGHFAAPVQENAVVLEMGADRAWRVNTKRWGRVNWRRADEHLPTEVAEGSVGGGRAGTEVGGAAAAMMR